MLRNNVANTITFFYPLGNTPAVCLTQDLLPEQDADILLLGCGDARNILFTTHSGSGRRLDITCCDIEPAILARNILLFTLLIDSTHIAAIDRIWNVYYHLYIDDESLHLLNSQAVKLLSLSDSLENWNVGQYGRALRFCDLRTFAKVKGLWTSYCSEQLAPQEKVERRSQYQATIDKARTVRKRMTGESISMSDVRSAAPVGIQALDDLATSSKYFWEHGTVIQGEHGNKQPEHPNPTFTSSPNETLTLHYGLNPLVGFHLATAYAPLTKQPQFFQGHQQSSSVKAVVETAQQQFREWSKSFQRSVANGSIFRFFTGDALAFCHKLQQVNSVLNSSEANLYCDNWTFQPLKLDSGDYESCAQQAPFKFDVIDTSNLVDHLGALNILIAATPLLADKLTSTLYTEVLVQHESSVQSMVDNILCGHFGTTSLLLGLSCVEAWTNATAAAGVEEGMVDAVSKMEEMKAARKSTQLRTRLCWKKLSAILRPQMLVQASSSQPSTSIEIDAQDLSRLLHSTYQAMFCHEDVRTMMISIKIQGINKLSNPYYNRASFAALLKHLKSNIIVDWNRTLSFFLNVLEEDSSLSSVSRNYLQELNLYLHLSAIHTVKVLQDGAPKLFNIKAAKYLSSWDRVPPVLCITFEVPEKNLKVLKEKPLGILGTPSLCCTVQSSRASRQQWANNFSAIQIAMGNINPIGNKGDADFHIEVNEDLDGWFGKSPLVVSFFIPTWIVLLEPRTALVACGLQSTPIAAVTFAGTLGLELKLFETNLGNDQIYVTKFMPHMSAYPVFGANSNSLKHSTSNTEVAFRNTISANLTTHGSQVNSLTCKIDFISAAAKAKLSDKDSLVELNSEFPMVTEVVIGKTVKCRAVFPVPVSVSRSKLRIARKSSYVEVIAPILHPLDADASPDFMFPLSLISNPTTQGMVLPTNWNLPYITLDVLPVLNIEKTSKLQWLVTHASLMFTSRERKIREAGTSTQLHSNLRKEDRIDFKDGLFSLLIHFSGLQGGHARIFGLHKPDAGGIHILLYVSTLRLNLANHTVILDTAALPLSHRILGDGMLQKLLGDLQSKEKICCINVTEKELKLWKQILPALAERCRTWKHKPESCEYLLTGQIPPPKGLEDGHTPLCSCGCGQLPPKFMGDLKTQHLEHVLQKYATRVAISPVFSVPYVENCFLHDMLRGTGGNPNVGSMLVIDRQQCKACGSDKRKGSSGAPQALLTCIRCNMARYCSKDCQKADWKVHKEVCIPQLTTNGCLDITPDRASKPDFV